MSRKRKITRVNVNAPPSEKLCELLFVSYAQRLATPKKLVVYAPSQPEEELLAYDAKFVGAGFRELYLQFKGVYPPNSAKNDVRFPIDKHQLAILRDRNRYPPYSTYYVAASFKEVIDTVDAQTAILEAKDFLNVFLAVSAYSITDPIKPIWFGSTYKRPYKGLRPFAPYRNQPHRTLNRPEDWLYGGELFAEFLRGSSAGVGCSIQIQNGRTVRVPNQRARNSEDAAPVPLIENVDVALHYRKVPTYNSSEIVVCRVYD